MLLGHDSVELWRKRGHDRDGQRGNEHGGGLCDGRGGECLTDQFLELGC